MKEYHTPKTRQKYLEKRLHIKEPYFKWRLESIRLLLDTSNGFMEILRRIDRAYYLMDVGEERDGRMYIYAKDTFQDDKEGEMFLTFQVIVDCETEKARVKQALLSTTDSGQSYSDDDEPTLEYDICIFNVDTLEITRWYLDSDNARPMDIRLRYSPRTDIFELWPDDEDSEEEQTK